VNINQIDIDGFAQRAQSLRQRLVDLYQSASLLPSKSDVIPQAFSELGVASEIVRSAYEELHQQNVALIEARNLAEGEGLHYRNLFQEAPDCYIVTDPYGIITQANLAAARLFNISQPYLVGKPIINFVALKHRQYFRSLLNQLKEGDNATETLLYLQRYNGNSFNAALSVAVVWNQQGEPIGFRWLIRDITEHQIGASLPLSNDDDLVRNYPLHKYCRGEIIPLNSTANWLVHQGIVKLTALCTGEEVLVGLAKEGMVFGFGMTSLQTYQATALSNVSLVFLESTQIAASPKLSHVLLPKINQRLQQTESFLAVYGMRHSQERFWHLLQVLKEEVGQPVVQGTRLELRLTHEELASACGTTRVTITRLIGKFQRQGLLSFDQNNHIIIHHI
jgi:PAS domain S-box-containing protein